MRKRRNAMEVFDGMPVWRKALTIAFIVVLPFIGSINGIVH